jgi:hypothetical protein
VCVCVYVCVCVCVRARACVRVRACACETNVCLKGNFGGRGGVAARAPRKSLVLVWEGALHEMGFPVSQSFNPS